MGAWDSSSWCCSTSSTWPWLSSSRSAGSGPSRSRPEAAGLPARIMLLVHASGGTDDKGDDRRQRGRHPGPDQLVELQRRAEQEPLEVAVGVAAVRKSSLERCQEVLEDGADAVTADVLVEQEPPAGPE